MICAPPVSPCPSVLTTFGGVFDVASSEQRLRDIETELSRPGAWDKPEALTPVLQEKRRLEDEVGRLTRLKTCRDDMEEWLVLASENEDQEALESLEQQQKELAALLDETELVMLLSAEEDGQDAILEIHPGAGGTESQDWAEMLLRLYTRWAARRKYAVEEMDFLPGDEAGIKSATIKIEGDNAYGYLKSENGVHRLVRISPYDASGRRHTSFAAVEVMPEIAEDNSEIELRDDEIKMDVYRSSGAGGQKVNKTSSAVRLTHLPTGIVVSSQVERSHFQNLENCKSMLRAKLAEIKEREHLEKISDIKGVQQKIEWGSQIRSYVFMPYTLAKDTRTGYENSNIQAVMDGDIDGFINAYLAMKAEK